MGSPLGPALANIFVGYYEEKLFSQNRSLQHTSDMLTTRLPSSITELKQINSRPNSTAFIHSSNSPLKNRKENVYRFLMFSSKEPILVLKPVHTGNPLSPASIYIKCTLVLSSVKCQISTLVRQALMICTKRRLNGEIERIKKR